MYICICGYVYIICICMYMYVYVYVHIAARFVACYMHRNPWSDTASEIVFASNTPDLQVLENLVEKCEICIKNAALDSLYGPDLGIQRIFQVFKEPFLNVRATKRVLPLTQKSMHVSVCCAWIGVCSSMEARFW
jgi:hypothetical protein